MSVHNSNDGSKEVENNVTLISKLDISDPLHLHPNDTTALTVVLIKLKGTGNYQVWSCAMLLALEGKNKIGFIDGSCKRSNTYEVLGKQWDRYDAMVELPKCVCNASEGFKKHNQLLKLMQFLMGLNDSYMQIKSSILSKETLPGVRSAYAIISSEESYRVAVGSIAGSSQRNQACAFVSNVPNSQSFQRSNQNFNVGPLRPNNMNNNRQGGGCFKIIGYPTDFGKKKSCQNFKKQSVSNNNYVRKSSPSGFTDEQMTILISLIKDNKVGKKCAGQYGSNGKIIDSGANQHMTYTDKELDDVLDISHLKIKVGHPNGTEAYISKIENLRLSNDLTLYDVMVIPEYCVTLILVHKLVKENKVIVAFDENRCYFLNQDLNLKNVLGIGEQCEGLLGHPADHVLNVLKDSLNIDKKDNIVCCEICQRAKQTKEPFPLSDHKSKSLGDLVHLDLWGPYKEYTAYLCLHFTRNLEDIKSPIRRIQETSIRHIQDIVYDDSERYQTWSLLQETLDTPWCMTRSSTKELLSPFKDPEREFRSSRKLFKTLSLDESRSPVFDQFSDLEENFEEEVAKTMAETMEQYMSKTRDDY
ncbi:ribonuclease H-like domain-containing protein [Tanacetum coccineum]|uniref:Ribonuclease H-like domain-containing protein n=1 Tax=Tanacetum coccineum TaxID=301880 RepID=A0ABQ5FJU0_9ASTR